MKDHIKAAPAPRARIEDIAKYDIVLINIANTEDSSEKAIMAIAYVLFDEMIKAVYGGTAPSPQVKSQMQGESIRRANEMAKNLPVTLKKSVNKREALFFKERLAKYGVTALVGYCPNCGGSLNETSERCTVCGHEGFEFSEKIIPTEVKTQQKASPQQKTKKVVDTPKQTEQGEKKTVVMAVVIAVLATIVVIAGVVVLLYFLNNGAEVDDTPAYSDPTAYEDQQEPDLTTELPPIYDANEIGNTSGNIAGSGLAAIQGEWIYFFGGDGLYRKMVDGSEEQKLTDGNITYINVVGNLVYFANTVWGNAGMVYRIETDGSNREELLSVNGRISSLHVIDDWIYFIVTYFDATYTPSAYRMRIDGSDKHLIFDSFDEAQVTAVFYEEWLYWSIGTSGLYRVSMVDREVVERVIDTGLQQIDTINIVDDWIYFTVFDFNTEESILYRARTDGTDRQMISDESISKINVSGDWIYSVNENNEGVFRIRIDGTDREIITDFGNVFNMSVVGDWMYLTLFEWTTMGTYIYRVNTNGRNLERVHNFAMGGWSDPDDTYDPQSQSTTEMLYFLIQLPAERVTIYIHWEDGGISYFTDMLDDDESRWMMYDRGSHFEMFPEFILRGTILEVHYLDYVLNLYEHYVGSSDTEAFHWRYEIHFP